MVELAPIFESTLLTVVLGSTVLFLFYRYLTRNESYWSKKGIPQVPSANFLSFLSEAFKKPFNEIEVDRYKKFGRLYGRFEGSTPVISVADPDLVRNILVKDFHIFINRRDIVSGNKVENSMIFQVKDEDWRRLRNIISPTFTTGKIKKMMNIFLECSATLKKNFQDAYLSKKPTDLKIMYGAFVTDVIASAAFSTKIDSHNDPTNEFTQNASEFFSSNPKFTFYWKILLLIVFPRMWKLFRLSVFPQKSMEFFTNVIYQIIEERKRTGEVRNDFLQLLMNTAKETENIEESEKDDTLANYDSEDVSQQILRNVTGKSLTRDELVAQCVTFFIAGYHTIASTLAIASYYLALHQDIQEKLRNEIMNATEDSKGKLTYESVQEMKYLDNVISETLRLYPPAGRFERSVGADYKLGDTGIVLSKGTLVTIPVCAIQTDSTYFPDPERFDPDRFRPEEKSKRHPFAYFPFSAGPRNCVGMRFALVEMKVCLADVVMNFRLKTHEQTKIPLEFTAGAGLLSPKSIFLQMEPIETN